LFSFLTPFVAYLPAERLGSSGLVAVVVAGLVWGQGSHRLISARNRLSQRTNWATVDTLAEGAVFLAMGLQVFALFEEFGRENDSLAASGLTVVAALAAVLAVRAVFAGAVVRLTGLVEARRARRLPQGALVDPAAARLGWRDGVLLEWAGLRGVVTLAAAQTLPLDTPERPAVVLIAFGVAATSLMAQGLTLPLVLGRLGLAAGAPEVLAKWRSRARARLATAARDFLTGGAEPRADGSAYSERAIALELSTAPWDTVPNIDEPPTSESGAGAERLRREEVRELRLATIRAMRRALLAETAPGELPSSVLQEAFDDLDREELAVEGGPE
jgi:CPA1 family monovalent cation:H+ antiporter